MDEQTQVKEPQGSKAFYEFTICFDEPEIQKMLLMGLSREQIFQRIMVSVAECIWESLPTTKQQVPS